MKSVRKKDVIMGRGSGNRINGSRNLLLLGIISILLAMTTTGVSLAIYHNSGDIYLDRSRPGYLPDEAEIEEEEEKDAEDNDYSFQKSGKITTEVLDEYLKELDEEIEAIDSYEKPFSSDVLSDENLGITDKAEVTNSVENVEDAGDGA